MMTSGKTLHVLPSSRSIRERIRALRNQDTFLEHYITIGEFIARLVRVDGLKNSDNDQRNLQLLEASKFEAFDLLQIERNFYTFIQNSHYIFRFLEELSGENVAITDLQRNDTYGDYDEHLQVLQALYERFRLITQHEGVIEAITLREHYILNREYLSQFDSVRIGAIGYLTQFEMQLLQEASEHCGVILEFEATPYNLKMQQKLCDLAYEVTQGFDYIINLSTHECRGTAQQHEMQHSITCKGFTQRLLQVAFVKEQLYVMVQSGIDVQRIAVVVPDEAFAQTLKAFDSEHNFNLAMGIPLSSYHLYQQLEAYGAYLDDMTHQNAERINRLGAEYFEDFAKMHGTNFDWDVFRGFMERAIKSAHDVRITQALVEAMYRFEKLSGVLQNLPFTQAFHLFMQRLREIHLDDVGGGEVTVVGLLETRGVAFDGVIIVDFNEGYVPRISEKDLFLSTQIRECSNLPTASDRQNLQKHYYHQLISQAKRVAISFVKNSESIPSRFLTQMQIEPTLCENEAAYANILFDATADTHPQEAAVVQAYDFRNTKISSTMLKTYLTCKRQFHYRYIQKIKAHQIAKELPQEWEIGTKLHEALYQVYSKHDAFTQLTQLRKAIDTAFESCAQNNVLVRFQLKLWREKLLPFCTNEIARFAAGVRVAACEQELTCKVDDLTLSGRIDRIDSSPMGLEILDYKSGSYTLYSAKQLDEAVDFQLEFYTLLASEMGRVHLSAYYDLASGEIIPETLLEAKLERLQEHLEALPRGENVNWERCDDLNACRLCDYSIVCGRLA